MGIERIVETTRAIAWDDLRDRLTADGFDPVLRMIDGLPAFPDESPDPAWQELRLGFPAGMITLRRDGTRIRCITWGTDDATLATACDACVIALQACGLAAEFSGGQPGTDVPSSDERHL